MDQWGEQKDDQTPMANKPALSTIHREDMMTLLRQVEADAHNGHAYAAQLLPHMRALGRQAATVDDGLQTARSLLLDPASAASSARMTELADVIALRGT